MTTLQDFCDFHWPALEAEEAKHNLMLAILAGALEAKAPDLRIWSLGEPGACAIKMPDHAIVLGDLSRAECHRLAERTRTLDYEAVLGPDRTAKWFVERAEAIGRAFAAPMPQCIHTLTEAPRYPGSAGSPRPVTAEDAALFADWLTAFSREAVPDDSPTPRARLIKRAGEGDHVFWVVEGKPVAVAGIVRRTRRVGAIASVYTPPELRGRGYAGSVTAAVVERIYAEGREIACLYTDLRNPASNRAYAKIGFKPLCESWFFARQTDKEGEAG